MAYDYARCITEYGKLKNLSYVDQNAFIRAIANLRVPDTLVGVIEKGNVKEFFKTNLAWVVKAVKEFVAKFRTTECCGKLNSRGREDNFNLWHGGTSGFLCL